VITVRLALPDEHAALEALQWRASLVHDTYRDALLAHPDAIDLPLEQITEGRVRVAESQGEVVGFAALTTASNGACDLDALFTEPDHWGLGVARALMGACEAMARAEKAKAITVVANPDAVGFYERVGFRKTGEAQTRFGPAVVLQLPVTT